MLNRRGDVPVTILVIGVVAICGLAIFSFIDSANDIQKSFVGPGLIEDIIAIKEEMRLEEKGFNDFSRRIGFSLPEYDMELSGSQLMPVDKIKKKLGRVEIVVDKSSNLITGKCFEKPGEDKILVYIEYRID